MYYSAPQVPLPFGGQGRVTARVRDPHADDYPVRTYAHSDRSHRGDEGGRDSCPLEFFGKRCTATRPSSSSGRQDGARYPRLQKLSAHFAPDPLSIGNWIAIAHRDQVIIVDLSHLPLTLEFP